MSFAFLLIIFIYESQGELGLNAVERVGGSTITVLHYNYEQLLKTTMAPRYQCRNFI